MKIIVCRGSREIGGSCIGVRAGKSRILLDLGLPLVDPKDSGKTLKVNLRRESPAQLRERGVMPRIPGVWADLDDGPPVEAILLSHPHQDHHGLLSFVRRDIPVYVSADALRMLNRSDAFIKPGARIRNARFVDHRQAKKIPGTPFTVTPFLMDHSAFGSMAYLVEADGRRLFYSGDFRGHGRKAAIFEEFCRKPAAPVDRLLIEGTTLGSDSHDAKTEQELENDFISILKSYSGLKLVSVSGQNIDRLVTIYRACKRSRHVLVLDLYTATILEGTARKTVPHPGPDWKDDGTLRIFFSPKYEEKLRQHRAYRKVLGLSEPFRITAEEIARQPGRHVMTFRDSLLGEYSAMADWSNGVLIYSQWKGYMQSSSFAKVDAERKRRGMGLKHCHTSGHASKAQLLRFARAVQPTVISPIHSFHADRAKELWPGAQLLEDGRVYEV